MHLLLEKITVIPAHDEGTVPRWLCTRPIAQYAVGVWTWRRINGAWTEGLLLAYCEGKPHNMSRVRLVVDGWPGMPTQIEIYDVIGEINVVDDLNDRIAQTEMLMGALAQMGERG